MELRVNACGCEFAPHYTAHTDRIAHEVRRIVLLESARGRAVLLSCELEDRGDVPTWSGGAGWP